jgi:AcrR family transcriptional regulator
VISQSKIEDKRERILIAARRLFVNHGIQGTPTASIAREAGVANGTLFHYFKTKEELINALHEEISRSFFIVTTAGIENEKTTKRKIRLWCSNTIKWALNRPHDYLFLQQCNNTPNFTDDNTGGKSKHMLFCNDLIDQGKEKKILKDRPSDILYQLLTYQIHGMINYLLIHEEFQHNITFLDQAFEICWDSISVK